MTRFDKVVSDIDEHPRFEKGDELLDELTAGTKSALMRDRNNKYDRDAIALDEDYSGDPDNFAPDFI